MQKMLRIFVWFTAISLILFAVYLAYFHSYEVTSDIELNDAIDIPNNKITRPQLADSNEINRSLTTEYENLSDRVPSPEVIEVAHESTSHSDDETIADIENQAPNTTEREFKHYQPTEMSKHEFTEKLLIFGKYKEFKQADFSTAESKIVTKAVYDVLIEVGYPANMLSVQCAIGYCEVESFNKDNERFGIDISDEKFTDDASISVPWERHGVFYDDDNESTIFYDDRYPEMSIAPVYLAEFIIQNDTNVIINHRGGRLNQADQLSAEVYGDTRSFHYYFRYER